MAKYDRVERLAMDLEKQGARVKRTTSGFLIQTDLGSTTFHLSVSDQRALRNMRARVLSMGLKWPSFL